MSILTTYEKRKLRGNIHTERAPPVAQWFCAQTGRREVPGSILGRTCRPRHFGAFRGFLRNSRTYGLGSLRKTPYEEHSPTGLGPARTIGLIPTIN